MATIVDIAKRAGVSTSTVSHVLNKTRRVLPDTAAAVLSAIEEMGYEPNSLARSLVRATSNAVGVAISAISNPYFSDLIHSVQRECSRVGLMVFLLDTEDDPERELAVVKALHRHRVDGVLLAPSPDPAGRSLAYLTGNKVPCVLVDRLVSPRFDGVGLENRAGVAMLVAHMLGHGHRRIGYVAGHAGYQTTIERLDGYREALHDAGMSVDEDLISPPTANSDQATATALDLLSRPDRPSALIAGNNHATIGTVRAIRRAGLRIPADVAIAGFDDFDWADDFEPSLTVIAQPTSEIGRLAAARLVQRMHEPDGAVLQTRLPGTLVIRSSCGCPRHGERILA
ncbi:MAG TPA: LacI family DNA-binding transcriptional regulator [Bradyrhizobium sp.]|nr:LacI family DNA-binding transcriptional regulator [Bradyrhizobium sp.]